MDFIEGIDSIMSKERVEARERVEYPILLEDLNDMIEMEKFGIEELEDLKDMIEIEKIRLEELEDLKDTIDAAKLSLEMMYDYAFLRFGVNLKLIDQNQE